MTINIQEVRNVSRNESRRQEIISELEHFGLDPLDSETYKKYLFLCEELKDLTTEETWFQRARRDSYEHFRGPLWLTTIAGGITTMLPFGEPGYTVVTFILFLFVLTWSIWASTYEP